MTADAAIGAPSPHGLYKTAARHGNLIFTAGMTPRENGQLMFAGRVSPGCDPGAHEAAVVLACRNALSAARTMLVQGEILTAIVSMTVYIAAEAGFTAHSMLADFASAVLLSEFGEAAIGVRAAVGVASLPGDATVEIQLVAAI